MRPIKQPLRPFVNAQEASPTHPEMCWAPSAKELADIHRGQLVKVCVLMENADPYDGPEQFWCEVLSVDGDTITAEVNSSLLFSDFHNLRCGDLVQFKLENVYQIMS